jgi:hypothetical protein
MEPVHSRVLLHAAYPRSLATEAIADLVRASACEVAERQGLAAPGTRVFEDHIELDAPLPTTVLVAIAAEVRRATGRWHRAKFGAPLWQGE